MNIECPCDAERMIDPLCCAAGMCVRTEEMEMERAELGVDGNCGFALLGENLQEGEAEFVEISSAPRWAETCTSRERWATTQAYRRLHARLPNREFSYFLGYSYPRGAGA